MIAKLCMLLLTTSAGPVLMNPSMLKIVRLHKNCNGYPYQYQLLFGEGEWECVKESPEEILVKVNRECK